MKFIHIPKYLLGILFTLSSVFVNAQNGSSPPPQDWFLLDPADNQVQGLSVEKTYATLLKGKPSRTVIVAVIDSGIDIEHEDLSGVIWTNEDEIAGNGIDDDNNGYIDDVHGWNFIGGKNGNVNEDTYELTREYIRLDKKFGSVESNKVSRKEKSEYEQYLAIKDKFEKLKEKNQEQFDGYSKQYNLMKNVFSNLEKSIDTVKQILDTESLTKDQVEEYKTNDPELLFSKGMILSVYNNSGYDGPADSLLIAFHEDLEYYEEAVDYFRVIVEYGYNVNFDSREIVGDNPNELQEKYYGNNDVEGPDPSHGTHVAGIIGADRTNNLGIKGIADNVKIMSVRAVPNGDERDKDVANAIIYAVDNGAHIINMSFGKDFSPNKELVDKAVQYAEQKGVLLIHAAGNDGDDIDDKDNFPTRKYNNNKQATNWLEIGASSWGADDNFVGNFSNYGKKSVDLFSPGVDIYSTTPDNSYKSQQGTSMASPAAAGVAAMIMSYFPEFSATQVRNILIQSTRKFDNLKVIKPGDRNLISFGDLSVSGGLINAYEAAKLAASLQGQTVER
ncbi:MAG: S8 family serine peptidase [Flammeovirgaceae bacterium]|nr:S8 family serine peptidase [Flammeovirgaceae bacterium]